MSTGQNVLRAVLQESDLRAFRDLNASLFTDDEAPAFTFVTDFMRRHGRLPTVEIVHENGISLARNATGGTLTYYMDRLFDRALYNDLSPDTPLLIEAIEKRNMQEVRRLLKQMHSHVRDRESSGLTQNIGRVVQDIYSEAQAHTPFIPGPPFGYAPLDRATSGMQPGDLNVFVGRTNVGKSFYLLYSLMAAWKQYNSPLVITMEMNVRQLATRMVGLHSGINTKFIRERTLSTRSMRGLAETVTDFQLLPPLTFVSGHRMAHVGIVEDLINELNPECVYIDAAYLIKGEGGNGKHSKWEKLSEVMESLKAIAERTATPILITVQFSRKQASGSSNLEDAVDRIGGTDAIGQLGSVVVAIAPASGIHSVNRRILRLDKNREGPKAIEWHTNFEFNPMNFDFVVVEAQEQRALNRQRMV